MAAVETLSEHNPAPAVPVDEGGLVKRARRGDRAAFGSLVERYMRPAVRIAAGLVGSYEDALDLSQEAFVRAFKARASLDPERPFYPWYYQILRRLCFNFLRDQTRRRGKLETATPWLVEDASLRSSATRPDRAAELKLLRRRLEAAIEGLSEAEREVFLLREFEGLRYREIAELAQIPMGTVMSRLYSARRRLANEMEPDP